MAELNIGNHLRRLRFEHGEMTQDALCAVHSKLHKKHYAPPFSSLNGVEIFGTPSKTGGLLLVGTTYHHGD